MAATKKVVFPLGFNRMVHVDCASEWKALLKRVREAF